jgi:aerobic carbon-monoxide dehydrogenase medium subunit
MIPAPFDYEVAGSVDEAVELLGREDAKLLAGGHSLLPLLRLRFAQPSLLVDVSELDDLRYVRDAGDRLAIGALSRHHDLETDSLLQEHCPLVCHVASLIGDPQVRHRGTIGGSVAHGDPASDLPTVLLALDAEYVIRGPAGERTVAADGFCTGVFDTVLGGQDVVTEIRVPKLGESGWAYVKFHHRAQDWATVGVAAVVNGGAKIALTNMGPKPLRASAAEAAYGSGGAEAAAALADEGSDPPTDTMGSADFRRHLAKVLTRRAVEEAMSRR